MTSYQGNGSNVAATTVTTCNKLAPATGGTEASTNTAVTAGTTGWVQIFSQGTGTAQSGAGSEPTITDSNNHGWMQDDTTFDGQTFAAGNWTPTITLAHGTGVNATADIHCLILKRPSGGGTYTVIGDLTKNGQAILTAKTTYTFSASSLAATAFATGDRLCIVWLLNITSGGSFTTLTCYMSTSASTGVTNDAQIASPGYSPSGTLARKSLGVRLRLPSQNTRSLGLRLRQAGKNTNTVPMRLVLKGGPQSGGFCLYANGTGTASFDDFRVTAYPDPSLALEPVGRLGSSFVSWNAILPSNATTLGMFTSLRGDGSDWFDISQQNGGPIPGLYGQPDPTIDGFNVDSHMNYSLTSETGGAAPTATYDTANSRLSLTGGTNGLYLYNAIARADIDLLCDMDRADAGGLVWRFVDASNFYVLVIEDAISSLGLLSTYGTDTFVRANQSGLGMASDGQSWAELPASGNVTAAIVSNQGSFTGNGTEADSVFQLGSTSVGDINLSIRFNLGGDATNNAVGLMWHSDGTANNYYRTFVTGNTLYLQKYVAGVKSTITSSAFTLGNNTAARLRVQMQGTTINVRAWLDGSSEPGTWNITTTDSSLGAGKFGIAAWINSSTATADSFSAVSVPSGGVPANSATLYSVKSGTQTQLAQATINFVRGTFHRFRVTMLAGVITATMDGASLFSYTDASPLGAGNVGLYNNGGATGSRYYELWIQPQGDLLLNKYIYTKEAPATTDATVTPQVLDRTVAAFNPNIGSGALIPATDNRKQFTDKIADDLVKQSGDYSWFIDQNLQFYFRKRTAIPAPWVLYSVPAGLVSAVDLEVDSNLQVTVANDLYRNRQTLTNVINSGTFSDSFIGDGNTQSFTLRYPIAPGTVPIITLDTAPQSVALKGQSGAQWYYAPGDAVIAQDANGTAIANTDTLAVNNYTGTFSDTITVDNVAAQQALAAVEGGTGIVEAVEDVSSRNMSYAAGLVYAGGLLARNCINNARTIQFTTLRDGLAVGQILPVFVPEEGLWDAQMLITGYDQTGRTQPGDTLLYTYVVTASELAPQDSWSKLLASGLLFP